MSPCTSDQARRSGAPRVVVQQRVVRAPAHRRGRELDFARPVVAVAGEHDGPLHVLRPFRVALELERHIPTFLRRSVDRDALGRLIRHPCILLHLSVGLEARHCPWGERSVVGAPQPAEPQAVQRDEHAEREARERPRRRGGERDDDLDGEVSQGDAPVRREVLTRRGSTSHRSRCRLRGCARLRAGTPRETRPVPIANKMRATASATTSNVSGEMAAATAVTVNAAVPAHEALTIIGCRAPQRAGRRACRSRTRQRRDHARQVPCASARPRSSTNGASAAATAIGSSPCTTRPVTPSTTASSEPPLCPRLAGPHTQPLRGRRCRSPLARDRAIGPDRASRTHRRRHRAKAGPRRGLVRGSAPGPSRDGRAGRAGLRHARHLRWRPRRRVASPRAASRRRTSVSKPFRGTSRLTPSTTQASAPRPKRARER